MRTMNNIAEIVLALNLVTSCRKIGACLGMDIQDLNCLNIKCAYCPLNNYNFKLRKIYEK